MYVAQFAAAGCMLLVNVNTYPYGSFREHFPTAC